MFAAYFMNTLGRESLIAADDTWALLALLVVSVALAIWLEQKYIWASKISGAIIALLIALAASNLSIIPTSCPLYDEVIWGYAVPLGIPLLLLECNMKKIWRETGRMMDNFPHRCGGDRGGSLCGLCAAASLHSAAGGGGRHDDGLLHRRWCELRCPGHGV